MRRSRRARRDGLGAYWLALLVVAGTAAIATFVFGREQRTVHSTSQHFHRHLVTGSFDPVSAVLRGLGPRATHARPGRARNDVRAVVLYPDRISLVAGGHEVRRVPVSAGEHRLTELVRAVHDPSWLEQTGSVVTVKAALVAARGAELVIAAPAAKTLLLERSPGVFVGARSASLRIVGVDVRSIPSAGASGPARPFVLAQRGSRMVIRSSTFRDLGRDWNTSYGVSWASGSTGAITGSKVVDSFIGIYSERAHDLVIRGNHLLRNTLYGVDPHSSSRDVVVEGNVANGNGRHGIIFSQDVTASVVRDNVVRGNRLNGIMMDAHSTGNLITRNLVQDNRGDGIVLAASPANTVTGNRILDNRIGIYARDGSARLQIERNVLERNARATKGVTAGPSNEKRGNGGEWAASRIAAIWLSTLPVVALLFALTWWSRASRDRSLRRRVTPIAR